MAILHLDFNLGQFLLFYQRLIIQDCAEFVQNRENLTFLHSLWSLEAWKDNLVYTGYTETVPIACLSIV